MNFDLRFPIGIMFGFYGLLLSAYGLFTNGDHALYERSLNININLGWGLVMLAFGVAMLLLSRRGRKGK